VLACILAMLGTGACFSGAGLLVLWPGGCAIRSSAPARGFVTVRTPRVMLHAGGEKTPPPAAGDAETGKEAALRRLAGTDESKAPPRKEVAKDPNALPEWAFFVLPIAGAICAFALQYFLKAPLPVG